MGSFGLSPVVSSDDVVYWRFLPDYDVRSQPTVQ